jgi:peptide/nickel transport system substrate-binding protein
MHNQLFAWDKDFTSQPQAVDTWSLSPDGLTYRFNLRRDLTFHDGSPVTTADVVPSFKPWLKQLTGARVAKFATDTDNVIEAVDDYTLQVRLAKPFCCLLASLTPAGRFGGVVYPKRIAELDAAKDVGEGNYVGTGPYKLKSWEVGNKATIERYDGYVPRSEPGSFLAGAQISYFDKITWLEIPSEETKIAGLKTGEWDVVDDPALDFYTDLKDSAGITTVVNRPGKLSGVVFRHDTSPSDNKLVRQAILAAVEVKPFMFSLTSEEDLWTHCASAFTCFHADAITTGGWTKHYDQNDLEKAKQLLAQSGYDGEEFLLMNPNDYGTITPLGPVFKAMMEDIGINVDMPGMDWSTLISRRFSDFPWNAFTLWGSFPFMYQPLFNAYVGVGGYKKYESEGMESLLNQYGSTFDSAEQQRIAGELMDVYYDEVPSIHFGQFFGIVPHSDRVKGVTSRIYTAYTNTYFGD